MRIYVATSWKNDLYPSVVLELRSHGHLVYDFRDANRAFNWSQIDPAWDQSNPVLSAEDLQRARSSREANVAYAHDKGALDWCDAGVVVMPCGRSAHLEAGYLIGQGKPVFILLANGERPDLMHKLGRVCRGMWEIHDGLMHHAWTWAASHRTRVPTPDAAAHDLSLRPQQPAQQDQQNEIEHSSIQGIHPQGSTRGRAKNNAPGPGNGGLQDHTYPSHSGTHEELSPAFPRPPEPVTARMHGLTEPGSLVEAKDRLRDLQDLVGGGARPEDSVVHQRGFHAEPVAGPTVEPVAAGAAAEHEGRGVFGVGQVHSGSRTAPPKESPPGGT